MTLQEICLGDTITFCERKDIASRGGRGEIISHGSYDLYIKATVAGKTKTGRLILSSCSVYRNNPHNPRTIKRSTRKYTDRLFAPFAALTVKPQEVRGGTAIL